MDFTKKLKLVFLPFILIVIGFVGVYTFLNWLLIIKLQLIDVKEDLINFWIPFGLPFIPVYFLLRPRLELLVFKAKGERDNTFPIMITWFTISIATIIAQLYLGSSTGKLTKLGNISQIKQDIKNQTRYYSLKDFLIDKEHVGVSNSFKTSGRYNTDFDMSIFVTCPILLKSDMSQKQDFTESKDPLLVINGKPMNMYFDVSLISPDDIKSITVLKGAAAKNLYGAVAKNGAILIETKTDKINFINNYQISDTIYAWLGCRFYKTISNSLSAEEKQEKYKAFALETERKFDTINLSSFVYLENAYHKDDFDNYSEAIDNFKNQTPKNIVINKTVLLKIDEPFEKRTGNKFIWIFGSIAIGSIMFLIILYFCKFDMQALSNFERGISVRQNDEESFFEIFIPREGFYITPILMTINISIFIIMVIYGFGFISFKGQDLINVGGNFRPLTVDAKQYWRLITNTFLHGGVMHVFANMYGLLFVGIFLEPLLGKKEYLQFI